MSLKNVPPIFFFENFRGNINYFNNFWYTTSLGNMTLEQYKRAHLTYKLLLHHLQKCTKWCLNNIQ